MNEIEKLGKEELLCQLAEEAAELSQAALKLRRAITGENPTPKTYDECFDALIEEIADVKLVQLHYLDLEPDRFYGIADIMKAKEERWIKRLKEKSDAKTAKDA